MSIRGYFAFICLLFAVATLHAGTTRYVDLNSTNPVSPFASWATAATRIQDAVDVSTGGDTILVTNGVYQTGGRPDFGVTVMNRVYVPGAVLVQSVNGPAVTFISGDQNPVAPVRCAFLTTGASLVGFTLTNGASVTNSTTNSDDVGGGIFCGTTNESVSNCIIVNCAAYSGGGIYSGTLTACTLQNNTSSSGGGGSSGSTLNNCTLQGNYAAKGGGGASGGILNTCLLVGNSTADYSIPFLPAAGGGAAGATLNNCTVVGNSAGQGGGTGFCKLNNCIVYFNTCSIATNNPAYANYFQRGNDALNYCCTLPLPTNGIGNITNAPLCVGQSYGNLRLQPASPCINTGSNAYAVTSTDLDGRPRILDGTVDIGAYEFQLLYHYVDLGSTNPVSPFSSWATAATNIQDAVDAALPDDTVFVTNGDYQTGGRAAPLSPLTNRVFVDKPITLQSVNGSSATIIRGFQQRFVGDDAPIRCIYLANGATLVGFSIVGGATIDMNNFEDVYNQTGGGVFCESTNVYISECEVYSNFSVALGGGGTSFGTFNNCSIYANRANYVGGGAYQSVLNNCRLFQNVAMYPGFGAGAEKSILNNCVLSNNTAGGIGGGADSSTLVNCLVVGNTGDGGGGISESIAWNCIVSSNLAIFQAGGGAFGGELYNCLISSNSAMNLSDFQNLATGGGAYYCKLENCTVAYNYADSDGATPYCDLYNSIVYYNQAGIGDQNVSLTNTNSLINCCSFPLPPRGFGNVTNAPVFVDAANSNFRLQSNSPCINAGNNAYAIGFIDLDGNPRIVGGTVDIGAYEYHGPLHYVDLNSTNPVSPFNTWATAATNIQDAVDAAINGDAVVVTNGVYQTGGRVVAPFQLTNRVVINKPITVTSVTGPSNTFIVGHPNSSNAPAIRCVNLASGASLVGFTITNGGTLSIGDTNRDQGGAGIWCASTNALVSGCIIISNRAFLNGGGVLSGTLVNCTLISNRTSGQLFGGGQRGNGGGVFGGNLTGCVLVGNVSQIGGGGGAFNSTLVNCMLSSNAAGGGGGAATSTLNNCLLTANVANEGGGAANCSLFNCTVATNAAGDSFLGSPQAGGISGGTAENCIIYSNMDVNFNLLRNFDQGTFRYCCTYPLATNGFGNITNAPLFVDPLNGNYRLQSNSPCINAGNNVYVSNSIDFDGNPRIAGETVDMGAYEFQSPTSLLSYAWAQQFGLPTDGSADFADADGDGMNDWQEWRAGTDPTNASSKLLMLSPVSTNSNVVVAWQSATNVTYFLQRSSNLLAQPAFLPFATNIAGHAGTTSYTDTNASGSGPFYYRVGVQ